MRKARVTSRDVAQLAGVSYNTVSLVVKNSPLVAASTRKRVLEAIEQLGYQPHAAAVALRSSRTQAVGYFVPGPSNDDTDVFYNRLLSGVSNYAAQVHNYVLLTNYENEQHALALMNSSRIDGALAHFGCPDAFLARVGQRDVPLVLMGRESELPLNWVKADEEQGAFEGVRYLIGLGHKHIAMLSARVGNDERNAIPLARERGYQRALEETGLAFERDYVLYGDWTYRSGYDVTLRLLEMQPRATAMFISNEIMAVGALHAIQAKGMTVPDDIALVTVEDSSWVEYVRPRLTAVHVPMNEVGMRAMELLMELRDREQEVPEHITVPTTLIIRESTV